MILSTWRRLTVTIHLLLEAVSIRREPVSDTSTDIRHARDHNNNYVAVVRDHVTFCATFGLTADQWRRVYPDNGHLRNFKIVAYNYLYDNYKSTIVYKMVAKTAHVVPGRNQGLHV